MIDKHVCFGDSFFNLLLSHSYHDQRYKACVKVYLILLIFCYCQLGKTPTEQTIFVQPAEEQPRDEVTGKGDGQDDL